MNQRILRNAGQEAREENPEGAAVEMAEGETLRLRQQEHPGVDLTVHGLTVAKGSVEVSSETMDKVVKDLQEAHPNWKVSWGYIGNHERWGDDTSWRLGFRPADKATSWVSDESFCVDHNRERGEGDAIQFKFNKAGFDWWVNHRVAQCWAERLTQLDVRGVLAKHDVANPDYKDSGVMSEAENRLRRKTGQVGALIAAFGVEEARERLWAAYVQAQGPNYEPSDSHRRWMLP